MSSSSKNNNEDCSNDNSKSSSSSSSGRKGANGSNSRFTPISGGGSISKRLTAMKMSATTSNSRQKIQCASTSQQAMLGEDPDDYASVSSVDHDRLRREMVPSSPAFGSQKTTTSTLQQEPHTFSTLLSTASSTNKSYAAAPSSIIQSSSSTASFENFEQSSTIPSGLKEDCQSKISLSKLFEKSDIDGLASSYIPSSSADQPASVTSPKTPITNKLLIPKRQQQSTKKSSWPDLKNKIYQQRKSAMSDTRSETMSFQTAMKNPSQPSQARRSFVKLSKESLQPPGAASRIIKATNSKERESGANLASSSNESLHKNDLPTEKMDEVVSAPKQQVSQGLSRDGLPRVGSLKDLSNNGLPNINGLLAKDVTPAKVGSSKEGTPKVGLSKNGTPKGSSSKEGLPKVRSSKLDSTVKEELSNEKLPKVVSSKTDSTPKDVGLPRVLSSKDSSPKDGFIKRKVSKVLSKEGPSKRSSFFSKEKVLTKEGGSDLTIDDFQPKNASSSKDSSLSKDFCLPKDVPSKESCPKIQGSKDQLQSKEKLPGSKELLPREQLSIEFYPPSKLSKSGDPVGVVKNSPAKGESVLVKMSSPPPPAPRTPKTSKTSTSACTNDQKLDDDSRNSKTKQSDEKVEQSSKSKKGIVIQERSNSNSKKDDDKVEKSTKSKKSSSNSSKATDDDQEKSSKSRKSSSNSRKGTDDREQSSKSRKSSSNSRKRTDDRERSSKSRRSSRSSRSKRRSDKTERSSKSKKKTTDNGNNEQSNSDSKKNSDDKSEVAPPVPTAIREYRSTRTSGPSRGGKSEYYDPSENNPKMGPFKESKSSRSAKKSGARKVPPTISSSDTRLRLKELQFYEIFRLIMVIVTVIQGACLLFAVVLVIWLHERFLPLLQTQHGSEQTGYIILITLLVIQFLVLIWSWALLVWERTVTLFLSTLLTAGMQITMIVYFSSGDIFRLLSLSLLIYAFLLIALAVEDWRLKETRSKMHHK